MSRTGTVVAVVLVGILGLYVLYVLFRDPFLRWCDGGVVVVSNSTADNVSNSDYYY